MTIEDLISVLGERRIHISPHAPLELKFPHHDKEFELRKAMTGKPCGLWWGIGTSWLEWCESEMPHWLTQNLYEVTPPERLLRISTAEDMDKFKAEYVATGYMLAWYRVPDWGKVAELYDGVEISPYRHENRYEDLWYYGWDVASGCAWKDAKVRLIGVKSKDGYELINED